MHLDASAETLSITRLEGSRWRGGRLWRWNRDLRAWADVDREAGGARATAASTRVVARAPVSAAARCSIGGWTHTSPETSAITWLRTLIPTGVGAHELSKRQVTVARWSAERIGPTIIAAPHRGPGQVARVGVSVVVGSVVAVAGADGEGVARTVRARATRVVRQVFARNPAWRMRTKPRGRTCWTKRRRNFMAVSVIVRRWSPRA
jgi:hypothetical protein